MIYWIWTFGILGLLFGDSSNKIMEFAFFLLLIEVAYKLGAF